MIKHEGDKWILFTADGSKRLGEHDTEEEALAQERAVQASKHRSAEFRTLLESIDPKILADAPTADKEAHPFTYCMEVVVPAIEEKSGAMDDPNAFCGWWKAEREFVAAENVRNVHLVCATGMVRTEMYDGREHLVVPVVALMEGVIHAVNAATPELVPLASLSNAPQGWNGRPIVLGHPAKDGRQISANDARVLESQAFGTIFNTRMSGTRLLMDAFIDPVKAERVGGTELLKRLRAGKMVEVSVGAFVTTENTPGNHNGKPYKAIWRGIAPDHLAFLPNTRGACSIEMGCGAHRAAEEAPVVYEVTDEGLKVLDNPAGATMPKRTLRERLLALLSFKSAVASQVELSVALEDALRAVVPNFIGVNQVNLDDTVVYLVGPLIGSMLAESPDDLRCYMRSFKTDKDANVELMDDAEEVEAVTSYEPVAAAGNLETASNPEGINQYTKGGGGGESDISGKITQGDIDRHDALVTTGFNSVSSKATAGLSHAEVKSRLQSAVGESEQYAKLATERTGGQRSELLAQSAQAYGRAQKLSNILQKRTGENIKVYHPFFKHLAVNLETTAAKKVDCPACKGSGNTGGNPCEVCDESGELKVAASQIPSGPSLDDRIQVVNTAVQKRFGTSGLTPAGSYAYAQKVYDDYVIIRKDDKLWSLAYGVGKDGEIVFKGEPVAVKEAGFVAAAGARNSAEDLTLIQGVHDHSVKLGARCSYLANMEEAEAAEAAEILVKLDGRAIALATLEGLRTADNPEGINQYTKGAGTGSASFNAKDRQRGGPPVMSGSFMDQMNQQEKAAINKATEKHALQSKEHTNVAKYIRGKQTSEQYDQLSAVEKAAADDVVKFLSNPTKHLKGAEGVEADQTAEAGSVANPAAADHTAELKVAAGCGCAEGAKSMTKEQKSELIKTLVGCKFSGFTEGDQAMLETASDERLESFRVASEARQKEVGDLKVAAAKTLTEEEFMKVAPPELKALIKRQQDQDTQNKAGLVAALKTAQDEYGEAELSAMPVDQLERMARVAKIDAPSYEGRGVPRLAAAKDDVYGNPPRPYDEALKAQKAS